MNPQQVLACLMAFVERDLLRAEIARRDAEARAAQPPVEAPTTVTQ